MPPIDSAFSLLSRFTVAQWAAWIEGFVNGTAVTPSVSRGNDPAHLALNAIYDQLPESAKAVFSGGLAELLPAAQPGPGPETAAKLYTLLQVAAHVVPRQAQSLLVGRLTSECMRGISYAGWDLHSLLLVVCSQFGVDEKVTDYIFHSAQSVGDFAYLVICFRMLLKRGPETTPFLLLEQMLADLEKRECAERMTEVLDEAIGRNGALPLLVWFEEVAPRLKARGISGLDRLEEIAQEVVPWPEEPDRADPSMLLLAGWMHAPTRKFKATDIRSLLYVLHRSRDPKAEERVTRVLSLWASHNPDWEIIDAADTGDPRNYITGFKDTVRIIIHDRNGGADEVELRRADFQREVALVLTVALELTRRADPSGRHRHRPRPGSRLGGRTI